MKFYQAIRVAPGNARVVARLTDRHPLLLDKQFGEGRVLVFASTFDNVSNDFPLHASFVPFVEQTARYLGRLEPAPPACRWAPTGAAGCARKTGAAVEVLDPNGERALRSRRPPTRRIFS